MSADPSSDPSSGDARLDPARYVLLPGRHHAVTRFQVDYLTRVLAGEEVDDQGRPVAVHPGAVVVWAITSANHAWTRRNPLPGHRREALVERVALAAGLPSLVVPVPDVPQHPRFSELVVTTVATALPHLPTPDPSNAVVACSTPAVAADYARRGYRVLPVEAGSGGGGAPPARPWEVVERCAAADPTWQEVAHPEVPTFYARYGLTTTIVDLFADPVVSEEGDLTGTRDYRTYAASFETASDRKWEQVGPHLGPGRVLDVGCATGGLLARIAEEPRFAESDLFGVDVARPLLEEAEHKKAGGWFANPNIWFVRANILAGPVMAPGSVDSTVSVALTHEVFSYGHGRDDVELFAARVREHTRPGGVWVNSDVLGPEDPDRRVRLVLAADDGVRLGAALTDLDSRPDAEVAALVGSWSTTARMVQFAHDFPRLSGSGWSADRVEEGERESTWELRLGDAMEFLTTKDYADNWLSECHEQFCGLSWSDWVQILTEAGLEVAPASRAWTNPWIVEQRLDPVALLVDPDTGTSLPWPETHVLTVARRPLG